MSSKAMDSRPEQVAILIARLTEHFKISWASGAPGRIGIPAALQMEIDSFLPRFDNGRHEGTSLPEFVQEIATTALVSILDSLDTWGRLDEKAFVTVARILLATESCLRKEQGLFQLMCVLEENVFLVSTSEGNRSGYQRLAEFKAAVGELLLFPLYFTFIDNSKPSRARRWVGFLLCHLVGDSDENVRILKGFPSQWFKNLGKIVIESNDRLLKGVAGKLIAETLTGLQLHDWSKHMKYFWPLGMTSYYADFPGEFEEEGWERRLFKFIDDMERKHQTWQSTGFNATNITIGDCEIESESTLMSLTDFISAYIPRRGTQRPVWIDVKACNVEIVDIYSPYTQEGDPTQVEEDKLVDLQITMVDYHAEGYLFLRSSQPLNAPDKIAFTVKDVHGDLYADIIEKTRNLARFGTRRPAPGEPLSDLELPTGSHKSHNDMQAALERRREAITSMADSPTVSRINPHQKTEGEKDSCTYRVEGNGISHPGSLPTEPQNAALASQSVVAGVSALPHFAEVVSGDFAKPGAPNIVNSKLPGSGEATVKSPTKEAGISQHLKALKKGTTMEKKETFSKPTTAFTVPGNLAHTQTYQKKHIYESDSELSELSEPPEELESIIALSIVNVDTPQKSNLAAPRFKKAEKVTEQDTSGSGGLVRSAGELPKISGKKQTWLGTSENGGGPNQHFKGIKDASKQEGAVSGQVFLGEEQMFKKSQAPNSKLNDLTATATGVTQDRIQQKPSRTPIGLIDSSVYIPTSLEKSSTSTKSILKRVIMKPTPQPPKETPAAVVRRPPNSTKQVKDPIKIDPNGGKGLDIYELPSDNEEHYILPVKGKGGKVKQTSAPAKGKGKKTTAKKSTTKLLAKSAPEAAKNDTGKVDERHRNKAGVIPSKLFDVPLAKEVTGEANAAPPFPTAIRLAPKIPEIGKESKNVQGKTPQRMSIEETVKHSISKGIPAELLVHKIQGDRPHDTLVERRKVIGVSKMGIQETGKAPQGVRVSKKAVPNMSRIPAKQGKVEVPAYEVQISNIPGDAVSVQHNAHKNSGSSDIAHEAEDAPLSEASTGAKICKGDLISVLPDNIQKHAEGGTKEAEVENSTSNVLPFKPSAIGGYTICSGTIEGVQISGSALKRKAKVTEKGPSCKRLQEMALVRVEPAGRTRRAAAGVALPQLKFQDTGSSQNQGEGESTRAVDKLQKLVLGPGRSVESPYKENGPSPCPQKSLPDVENPNNDGFPDLDHHPQLFELIAEQQHDRVRASDVSVGPRIVRPGALAVTTEKWKPSAMVSGMEVNIRGDGLATLSGSEEVRIAGGATSNDGPVNHFQQNSHLVTKPVVNGTRTHMIAVKFGDDEPSGTLHIAPDKAINEIGLGKRKRIVRPQPANLIPSLGLSREQSTKELQISNKGNETSRTKLQAAPDPETPDVSLDNPLNRKPQIISWGKQGPLNQGRLVDTLRAHGQHNGLSIALFKAQPARHVEEDSPSQRVRTKKQKIGATIQGEKTWPSNTEYTSPLVGSVFPKRKVDINSKEGVKCTTSVSKVSAQDVLQEEEQCDESHVPASFSDLPGTERGWQRGGMALLAHRMGDKQADTKVEEHTLQLSTRDFILNECDSTKENSVLLPKTPEGKRTDFWNEPGYTGNIDVGSEEATGVEGLFNQAASIPRMKQMVLSEDVPPALIKQSGKRIESATMDDPFKDLFTTRPLQSSFLKRLNTICNRGAAEELRAPPEDRPKPQSQSLKSLKRKPQIDTLKHTLFTKARVAVNTIPSLDPKVTKARAHKESWKKDTLVTKKPTDKATYPDLTLPTQYGVDTEMTIDNSSSPRYYHSGAETTSNSYTGSYGDFSANRESSNILERLVKEASPEGGSDDSSIQDLLNIFSGIGKLFEEDIRAQEAVARHLLTTFKSSALQRVGLLKRVRELEFDDYTKRLDGPVTRKGKHACWAAQAGLREAAELVYDREGKVKVNRVGCKEGAYCRAEKIETLCKGSWEGTDRQLQVLERSC